MYTLARISLACFDFCFVSRALNFPIEQVTSRVQDSRWFSLSFSTVTKLYIPTSATFWAWIGRLYSNLSWLGRCSRQIFLSLHWFLSCFLEARESFLTGLAGLSKNKKDIGCGRFTGLHFRPPPGSTAPGKYAISLLWLASFTDWFTFADSLPYHARARPMHPITWPFRLRQGRRRRRDGDKSRSTCWLNGGDLVVSVRRAPGAEPIFSPFPTFCFPTFMFRV